jgi:hypothetical protein
MGLGQLRWNPMLDFIVDLWKQRPMNARPLVVSRVVSKIASDVVEERVRVIPARVIVARRVLASMMIVCNP